MNTLVSIVSAQMDFRDNVGSLRNNTNNVSDNRLINRMVREMNSYDREYQSSQSNTDLNNNIVNIFGMTNVNNNARNPSGLIGNIGNIFGGHNGGNDRLRMDTDDNIDMTSPLGNGLGVGNGGFHFPLIVKVAKPEQISEIISGRNVLRNGVETIHSYC